MSFTIGQRRWRYPWTWLFVVLSSVLAWTTSPRGGQADSGPRGIIPLGLDLYMPVPEDNPPTLEKIALGRRLFSDPLLSRDGTKACVSCHERERAFTDGRAVAVGVRGQTGERSAPTLVNRGYGRSFFWDGRAPTLEAQVLEPIANPKELDLTLEDAIRRIGLDAEYRTQFKTAFDQAPSADNLARALASYVRTILSGNSPLDRFMNGERAALSDQQREGLTIFRGKGNCTACHVGPTLSDEQFHNTGVAWKDLLTTPTGSGRAGFGQAGRFADPGRFVVTHREADRGAFKTPTLREIARTAPYMHDGSLGTLDEVIAFYDRGGRPNPFLDRELRPLNLKEDEKQALLHFLQSLNGDIAEGDIIAYEASPHPHRPDPRQPRAARVSPRATSARRGARERARASGSRARDCRRPWPCAIEHHDSAGDDHGRQDVPRDGAVSVDHAGW